MASASTKSLSAASLVVATIFFPLCAFAQESPQPPPTNVEYFQYGVGLAVETRASGGDVCPTNSTTPCILGSGGGLALRIGYRARGHWYAGGAYEFSRQDSANLLRLAILQQLRGEARYYFELGTRLSPYVIGSLGAVLYGNEWSAQTGGVGTSLGVGLEYQVTESVVIGCSPAYRLLVLRGWTDTTGQQRADRYLGFGLAHMVAFELTLELRDALSRW